METGQRYRLIWIFLISVLLVWPGVSGKVIAGSVDEEIVPSAVSDMRTGILRLEIYVRDDKGNTYSVRKGTGILSGNASNGQYVVTSDELVTVEPDVIQDVIRKNGLQPDVSLTTSVDIVLEVGTRITMKTEEAQKGEGFVFLQLERPINEVACLKLGDSQAVKENDRLFLMGYEDDGSLTEYSARNQVKLWQKDPVVSAADEQQISMDVSFRETDLGLPVFNANGYVVGMVLSRDQVLYVKPIDRIKDVLNVLGLYYEGTDRSNHYNEVTDAISKELNDLLLECESIAVSNGVYTEKSIDALKNAIMSGIEVTMKTDATYDDYRKAIDNLNKYKGKLHKKDYPVRVFQIVMLVLILVFAVINMRMERTIKKLGSLSQGGSGTAGYDVIYAKLIRVDTMQEIPISNVIFRIGQSAQGMDYGVENNTSVSRHHADIMRKGTEFYILDNNSTNHTYVNGQQVMPGEYFRIKGGDRIRLSDVEFLFEV